MFLMIEMYGIVFEFFRFSFMQLFFLARSTLFFLFSPLGNVWKRSVLLSILCCFLLLFVCFFDTISPLTTSLNGSSNRVQRWLIIGWKVWKFQYAHTYMPWEIGTETNKDNVVSNYVFVCLLFIMHNLVIMIITARRSNHFKVNIRLNREYFLTSLLS